MERPLLKKGGTVMIVSPAWFRDEARTYGMETYLNAIGFEAETHPHCLLQEGQFSGSKQERLAGIHESFMDNSIHAVIAAGGGYGCLQLLDGLNYDLISKNPKPFCGYSDVTALLNAIYTQTGMVTYHGLMGDVMTDKQHANTTQSFLDVVVEGKGEMNIAGDAVQLGISQGTLVGGNMTIFDQLIGTPYMPNDENVILFLEDTNNEKINELDKKLLHLKHAGFLNKVRGVILGEFHKLSDNDMPFGKNAAELVREYLPGIPCVQNVKCGHEDSILTFPVGAQAQLTVKEAGSQLTF